MAKLVLTTATALVLAAGSSAEIIWSSVAYINNGDRTPLLGFPSEALTPLGARQLFQQGEAFRARYLDNTTLPENVTHIGLHDIHSSVIVDSSLAIHAVDQQSITGGALAFLQALYPPKNGTFADENGGGTAANQVGGRLSSASQNFPGNGYQFPRVQTASILDPEHVWLDGHNDCRKYVEMATAFQSTDASARDVAIANAAFYQSLSPAVFPPPRLSGPSDFHRYFYQAKELYNYAVYGWNHDAAMSQALNGDKLARLRSLASAQQKSLHGNISSAERSSGDNKIRGIAGRTFAGRALKALRNRGIKGSNQERLTLLFGGSEAFTAFFNLAGLSSGTSQDMFTTVPEPGAAMIFELFSLDDPTRLPAADYYPSEQNLYVRFLYRAGTSHDLLFRQYSIFGYPNAEMTMRLGDFAVSMQKIGIHSVGEWCAECGGTGQICLGSGYSGAVGSGSLSTGSGWASNITPAVGGAIGALVTLAVLAAATMALMVLGGFRIRRANRKGDEAQPTQTEPAPAMRPGGLGGFKGAEKMASDTDLTVARGGIRHERTGSWELRDGGKMGGDREPSSPAGASFNKDVAVSPAFHRRDRDDDAVSVLSEMNATPVRPRESV